MNVLIIGSGGRESAMAWAVSQSPRLTQLYVAPGNGGTLKYGENVKLDIKPPFIDLLNFVEDAGIELTIVGPEQPLVDGIVEAFKRQGHPIFGPSLKAARLEGSKVYMKEFMDRYHIPTAKFKVFEDADTAIRFVERVNRPFVIKTDGLAAGKGALVNLTVKETLEAINTIMVERKFGTSGNQIVVEDLLTGTEVSVFVVTDGKDYQWLASAQDHKRVFDNDEGLNTGGMGAFAPAPFLDEKTKKIIEENIIKPTILGMQQEGSPYTGILYIGLMLTNNGPMVVEYNVRFGDPEAQVVLPLLDVDFLTMVQATAESRLQDVRLHTRKGYCCGVVMASGGYPDAYQKSIPITGNIEDEKDIFVFHAGTTHSDEQLVTNGGRVLCVSAIGVTLEDAIEKAYRKVDKIHFEGQHYRKDIGQKGLTFIRSLKEAGGKRR